MGSTSETHPISVEPTTTSKRRRKKSLVWDHFTVETLAGGGTRACCNLCKQTFAYSTGAKLSGTSHLKRHILLGSCPVIRQERKQLALTSNPEIAGSTDPPKRRYRTSSSFSTGFDQEQAGACLAKMIIMHEYPLNMVEHTAFISFVQGLQPRFRMPDINAVEGDIMAVYHKEKHNLSLLLGTVPGRVSLTICLWSTSQSLGYVSLTGHFIDSDWKLHRRMLNFMMVSSPHSENALSEAIEFSLSDWNIKSKLFTITLDNNCSSYDIYSANLRDHLSKKNTLMLNGQLFVVRCYAHILNVVAQDLIASIHGIVYNIRESVKYVKASVSSEEKFVEIVQHLQISGTMTLSLDVQTQWNTTYLMLACALEFRNAFTYLETCDANYNEAPSSDDWRKIEIVCTYLKLLYDSANVIMGTTHLTSNIYFHEASKIQLDLTNAALSADAMVSGIAKEIHEKFEKYWNDSFLVLSIAVIMDPRFKMKLVEFCFTKIYGEDATRYISVVSDSIHELYLEYFSQPLPLSPAYAVHGDVGNKVDGNVAEVNGVEANDNYMNNVEADIFESDDIKIENVHVDHVQLENIDIDNVKLESVGDGAEEANSGDVSVEFAANEINYDMSIVDNYDCPSSNINEYDNKNSNGQFETAFSTRDGLMDFDIYISEMAVSQQTKSELEQYLEEALVPRIQEFDILYWWRLNTLKYPTLSKMARDVLSIPMSMASSAAIFSSGSVSRMLDEYRSSLRPETVEALFCVKDWLQYAPADVTESPSTTVKMEF